MGMASVHTVDSPTHCTQFHPTYEVQHSRRLVEAGQILFVQRISAPSDILIYYVPIWFGSPHLASAHLDITSQALSLSLHVAKNP